MACAARRCSRGGGAAIDTPLPAAAGAGGVPLTFAQAMAELEARGDPAVRKRNANAGAEAQFGVKMGDIRKVAALAKRDHALALRLWATGNLDARLLATLLLDPKKLGVKELEGLVRDARVVQLADWVNAYVVKAHPEGEGVRERWMDAEDPWLQRAGWGLTQARVERAPEGLDLVGLLDRIEASLADAAAPAQWTMNNTLAFIGIHHAKHRKRAVAIGERLGVYRDYPTPKGCTSPFAPEWIAHSAKQAR